MASTGEVWKLGHRPALDGLRGIAVLLVLATHLHLIWWSGASGAVGVAAFFTLSGFLITTLLLDERAATGGIRLRRFFARRAARLVPAMLLCVVLAVIVELVCFGRVYDWGLIVGTLTYTSNMVMMLSPFPAHTGLGHTWSLAVEEQFYLLWPPLLLALVRLPRRWVMVVLGYGIAGSLLVTMLASGWRPYFGLDSRAGQLFAGAMLAWCLHRRPDFAPSSCWAWVGLGVLGLASVQTLGLRFNHGLLPTVTAAGTVAVIYVAAQRPVWVLEWAMLRRCGERSYGLYLYHPPLLLLVQSLGAPVWLLPIVVLPAAWLVAGWSLRWIEQPVRAWVREREATPAPMAVLTTA